MPRPYESSTAQKKKTKPTGYWTFFCNPQKWEIDEFLKSGKKHDTFSITKWQKDWFKKGQLGVVRVGQDNRTLKQLAGKPRLKSGVYAIVEVLGQSIQTVPTEKEKKYWTDDSECERMRYRVPIKYVENLINHPVMIDDLVPSDLHNDKYLINGFQASTMPLNPNTFNHILDLVGGIKNIEFDFNRFDTDTDYSISELEKSYSNAVPKVKEHLSRYIERGSIAQKFKSKTNFKCQICDAMNLNPYSFRKSNGEYYVETHHVIPVSKLESGLLSTNNLLTVCANHHRQLHYGNVQLLQNDNRIFIFMIDGEYVEIDKMN